MPNHNRSNICFPRRKHRVSNLEGSVSLLKKSKQKPDNRLKNEISAWLGNLETYNTFFYCQKILPCRFVQVKSTLSMCIYCAGRKLWYNRRRWIILAKGACHHVSFPEVSEVIRCWDRNLCCLTPQLCYL